MLITDFECPECECVATNEIISKPDDTIPCKWCKTPMKRVFGNMEAFVRKDRMVRMKDDWKGRGTPYPKGKDRGKKFLTKLRAKRLGLG